MIANFLGETIGTEEKFNAFMSELTGEQKKNFLDYIKEVIDWFKATFTNSVPAEIRQIERLYKKAVKEAGEGVKKQKYSKTENEVDFLITNQLSNDDIRENINKVVNMSPVSKLTGMEFEKSEISLIDQVEAYFKSFNNVVTSKYGSVELTRKGIKASIGHGIGRNKAVAFKAVPDVIKYGEIIDYQINWKGRGYDTAVFAAPIKIKEIDYYLAAVITVEKSRNAYYLHEVALQKKEDIAMFKTGTDKNGTSGKAISPISMLLQKLQNVKSEEQFSVPTEELVERKERTYGNSIPERTRKLRQEYADGKIGFDELVEGETKLMEEARQRYGVIKEGENPQERVKVPRSVEKNKNVSQYVRTILETGVVSEALAAEIGEKTLLGDFSHEVLTDEKALEDADKAIKNGTAKVKWYTAVGAIYSMPTKNQIAVGEKLLEKAMKDGKTTEALEIASDLVDVYTRVGQLVQKKNKKRLIFSRFLYIEP